MEKYTVGDILGKGSFGCAKLGVRNEDGLDVVLKQIHTLEPRDIISALKEIRILGELDHPNVIRYIDSFQEQGCVNIVTEFATGGDLGLHIGCLASEGRRAETGFVFSILTQTIVALKYLHARKILHRDVKPANIFLMKNGIVKLGDFGVSTVLKATQHLAKTFCGTLHYLAPEVCEDKPYNNKADVWAVGCCIYELAALKRAFDAKAVLQLGKKICSAEYDPLPPHCPADLVGLVSAMLQKSAVLRPNASKVLSSPAITAHLCHLPEPLLHTERYRLTFTEEALNAALKDTAASYEDELKQMEEWAARDAHRIEQEDTDAFDSLMETAFNKTGPMTTSTKRVPVVPEARLTQPRPKGPELSSEVTALLAKREQNQFGGGVSVMMNSPLSTTTGGTETDEDFTDTQCIFTSPLTPTSAGSFE